MKKFLLSFLIALVLLSGISKFALADEANVNLTVKNNGDVVYSGTIPLSPTASEDNVLSVIKQADTLSPDFDISNIVHYSFGDYLKCITISGTTELCDNWLYEVNGESPTLGMDSYPLSGGENVVLYFGDENKAPVPEPEPAPETTPVPSSSGGGHITLNIVCEQGEKFSATTGQLCTSFIPAPAPISPEPTPPLTINLEKKTKTVLPQTPKKIVKNPPTLGKVGVPASDKNQNVGKNTASAINAVPPSPASAQIETPAPKKNWFVRLLDNIFSAF
jgi:hypothetical protein